MPHVRIQRLGAGKGQNDRTEGSERNPAVTVQEMQGVQRIDRLQDFRALQNVQYTHAGQGDKPDHDHWAEPSADTGRAFMLQCIQPDQHSHRQRHDIRLEGRRCNLQPFDCRQYGNCWSDDTIAEKQRGADQAGDH